jgi:hypothetical protein
MATYKEIQLYIRDKNGFVPKTCWIADILSQHRLTGRVAYNRISQNSRKHSCPPTKKAAIEAAFRNLGMI